MNQSQPKKDYFRPSLTVDVVLFTIEDNLLKTLLIKRRNAPFENHHALPGGFVHGGETTHDTAKRILRDKAGVDSVYVEQLYTFDDLGRDPRGTVFSVTYFALVQREQITITEDISTEAPEFISIKKLPPLAFDHKHIVNYALKRLAAKLQYTNIIFSLLPKQFTLSELQRTYETILEKKLDKRNFRKKYLQLGLIKKTNQKSVGGRQRPAELYRFASTKPAELPRFF